MLTYLIKKELQLFVGKVDTQLLKAVVVKFLKAENVQNAYKCKRGGRQMREGREAREGRKGGRGREREREGGKGGKGGREGGKGGKKGREGRRREEGKGKGEGGKHWYIQSLSLGHHALIERVLLTHLSLFPRPSLRQWVPGVG